MKTVFKWFFLFFVCSSNLWASEATSPLYTLNAEKKATIKVEVFLSSTCSYCKKADAFINSIAANHPDLEIHKNIINEDIPSLMRFNQLLNEEHMDDFSIPAFFFCNSHWAGFASEETTGADLLHAMKYCKDKIEKKGVLTKGTVETLRHWAYANRFHVSKMQGFSLGQQIIFFALADLCSPCAFFSFAGFLAFLFVADNRKKQILAALLYIFSVGITHYYQQVYSNSFNELLPWLRIPAVLIGLLAVYFSVQLYKKQFNTSLYYSLACLLGLMTNLYQQTCLINWSYMFQEWLLHQQMSDVHLSLIQLGYQFLYVLPLFLILILYVSLLRIKRIALWQSRFFARGWLFILAIALSLIIYPMILSHFVLSLLVLLVLIVCGRFLNLT